MYVRWLFFELGQAHCYYWVAGRGLPFMACLSGGEQQPYSACSPHSKTHTHTLPSLEREGGRERHYQRGWFCMQALAVCISEVCRCGLRLPTGDVVKP